MNSQSNLQGRLDTQIGDHTCLSPMADLVNTRGLEAVRFHKDINKRGFELKVKVISSACTFWVNKHTNKIYINC